VSCLPPLPPEERRSLSRRVFGCGCGGCLGLICFFGIGLLVVMAVPDPVALSLAALAAVLPVPTYAFVVYQLDRYEREPWRVLLVAFLWGAVVATFVSAILNDLIGAFVAQTLDGIESDVVTASAVAPVVEEAAKGLAVFLLYVLLRGEFDGVLDGIVYGSLVGIGFAMTENILYFGRIYLEGGLVGLGVLFYVRVLLGGFGHALYTGTTGAALGYARETSNRLVATVVPPVGFALAVLQHGAWNFSASALLPVLLPDDLNPLVLLFVVMPVYSAVLTTPGLLTLLIIAFLAWRRESHVIRKHLGDEVARGTLTHEEYEALPIPGARLRRELGALRRRGLRGWFAQRDFHQAATELAFRKWHLSRGESPKRARLIAPEDRYRRQIAALRARLA
jgi:protease PrsW